MCSEGLKMDSLSSIHNTNKGGKVEIVSGML